MSAVDSDQSYGFALLSPVGVGDLNGDFQSPKGFSPGASFFAHSPWGLRLYTYVQNRHTAAVVKGALMSAVGDVNGLTQITTSGGAAANTKVKATASGLTANLHAAAGFYVQNSLAGTGSPPEGEDGIIAANSTTEVFLEVGHPLSATLSSGDTVNIHGLANVELAAIGDLAYVVAGVVVGKDGISPNNYGFVARQGYTPNTLLKAATALTQNDTLIADAGRVGPSVGVPTAGNKHIGTARHVVVSDIASDKTSVILTLGPGFSPGTANANV